MEAHGAEIVQKRPAIFFWWWDREDKRYMHPTPHSQTISTDAYEVSFEIEYDIATENATRIRRT
jgi:hypothetical protein